MQMTQIEHTALINESFSYNIQTKISNTIWEISKEIIDSHVYLWLHLIQIHAYITF